MIILYQEIIFLQFYFQGLFSWTSFWPDFLGDSVNYMSANTHDQWKHPPLCLCSAQAPFFYTSIRCWRDHLDRYTGGPSAHCSTKNISPSLMGLSEIVSEF